MPEKINALDWTALVLVIIGGINWGMVGLFNIDVISSVFGVFSAFTRVVFTLVGLAALYMVAVSAKLAQMGSHFYGDKSASAHGAM